MTDNEHESDGQTITKERTKVEHPKEFRVYLLNDDYTPMDFVVSILETVFQKNPTEAVRIMLQVHNQGKGMCGVYTKEIAETKVFLVHERARSAGHPLKADMEEVA